MNTVHELKVAEARAAYLATVQTWVRAVKQFKRFEITQAELDAADAACELATEHYKASLWGREAQVVFSFANVVGGDTKR